jgi:hypothetical protein
VGTGLGILPVIIDQNIKKRILNLSLRFDIIKKSYI